jgi:glycosyltransferase involved in cell wall biosynthesis
MKYNINLKNVIKAAKKQSKLKESDVKISVVIPNYNYANFMYDRFYSILSQNIKLHEIIVLDDNSNDNSRVVIDEIVEKISDYVTIKKIYNTVNSGTPFKQWKKGFKEATGDYVWIAEADDFCSNKMLEKLVDKIKENKKIQIAYVDTAFIDKYGNIALKSIRNEIDIRKTGHWDNSFVENGIYEIENYCFLNCIIANVSSCLIKNENYDDVFEKISSYKQAGDWLFYNLVMKKGDICYISDTINYYRLHGNNVTSLTKKQEHFDEIVRIHDENRKIVKFTKWHEDEIKKRYKFLKRVWKI